MRREFDAAEPVGRFKPGIALLLAGLDPAEARLEGFVEPAHGSLGGTEVEPGEIGVGGPFLLEPGRLDGSPLGFVGGLPLVYAGIIEPPWVSSMMPSSRSWFLFVQSLYLKVRIIYLPFWCSKLCLTVSSLTLPIVAA